MKTLPIFDLPSSAHSMSIWIILAGLLVVSTLIGVGALNILTSPQQVQAPAAAVSPAAAAQ